MNILMLTPAYGKGGAATTQHWTELGDHLSHHHKVTVTTSYPVDRRDERVPKGVKIVEVSSKNFSLFTDRHLREVIMWFRMSLKVALLPGRYDLVICVDTPRFATLIAGIRKWRDRSRIVMWVMDLPLEQVVRRTDAVAKPSLFAKISNRLFYHSLRIADHIVVIGNCMRELIAKRGVPRSRMNVIGPWSDDSTGRMRVAASAARIQNDLPDLFTVMYLGYAGAWHEFGTIINTISLVLDELPVQFVFVGSGPGIDQLAVAKGKHGWDRVWIRARVEKDQVASVACCGDIHLVSLKENMLGTCSPSKTYSSMAFERPVVFLGPESCQAAMDINEAQAGEVVGNKEELIAAIKKLFGDRELLKSYGRNARAAFLNKHSASVNLALWDAVLSEVKATH